jgi:Tol biopolymer transport system component
LVTACTLVQFPIAGSSQTINPAEVQFEAARKIETIDGNLRKAIEQYRKLLSSNKSDRALSARVLLRIGICQERLAQADAKKSYEQILREYSDQKDVVAQARSRLDAFSRPAEQSSQTSVRLVHKGSDRFLTVSPDGRFIAYEDRPHLELLELATGKKRHLVKAESGARVWRSTFSPDGRRIAYTMSRSNGIRELHVVLIDGSGDRILYDGSGGSEIFGTFAWTSDEAYLLAMMREKASAAPEVVRIALKNGERTTIKRLSSLPTEVGLSPDGRFIAYSRSNSSKNLDLFSIPAGGGEEASLAAGSTNDEFLAWAPDGRIVFASDRRSTGTYDVWALPVTQGQASGEPQFLKRDGPRPPGVAVANDGTIYYSQGTRLAEVAVVGIDESGRLTSPPARVGVGVGAGERACCDWSPDGRKLAYWSGSGSGTVRLHDIETGEETVVRASWPAGSYSLRWFPDGKSLLVEGHSGNRPITWLSYFHRVNISTGEVAKLFDKDTGGDSAKNATFLDNGKSLLFRARNGSYPEQGKLYLRNLETGDEKVIFSDAWFGTWALSPDGRTLALGIYDGQEKRDYLKIAPMAGGELKTVFRTEPGEFIMKASTLAWSKDGQSVLVTRCKSGPPQKCEVWRTPINGGAPERIIAADIIFEIRLSPDGKRLAYDASQFSGEIWAMQNFLSQAP